MKLPLEQICLMLNIFGFPYESKITLTKKLVQQNIRYRITRIYFCLVTVSKFASGPWWDCETVGGVLGSSPSGNRHKFWCIFAFSIFVSKMFENLTFKQRNIDRCLKHYFKAEDGSGAKL